MTIEDRLEAYVASWSETDAEKRRALLQKSWADDGVYQDPTADVHGRDALVTHIGEFHQAMPGAKIEMASGISTHHGAIYFRWRLVTADGATAVDGVDFGKLSVDGRIAQITGFFGPPGA